MSKQVIYHLIPQEEKFLSRLDQRLKQCRTAILASAFFTFKAYKSLKESIQTALENGAKLQFLLGRFDFVTEPRAIQKLFDLEDKYPKQVGVFFDADYGFHYKLAIFKWPKKSVVIIGSSNLTPKGLDSIGEVNLEIIGNERVYRQAYEDLVSRIKVAVSAKDHIKEYERRYRNAKKFRRQRGRWHRAGIALWRPVKRRPIPTAEPEGEKFTFCWRGSPELDKRILRDVSRHLAKRIGHEFSNQWFDYGSIKYEQLFTEGHEFVLVDKYTLSLGFAYCERKYRVLNERDSQNVIVHYRFRRGWKTSYATNADLIEAAYRIGLRSSRTTVQSSVAERLKKYLIHRNKLTS